MHKFLLNNREALIQRCRTKGAQQPARVASKEQLQNGVPLFLDRLIEILKIEQAIGPSTRRKILGSSRKAPGSQLRGCGVGCRTFERRGPAEAGNRAEYQPPSKGAISSERDQRSLSPSTDV